MILTPDELVALTGRKYAAAQARELEFLSIPFKPRRDGSLVVLRIHVEGTQDVRPPRREPRVRAG